MPIDPGRERTIIKERSPCVPLIFGTPNIIDLAPRSQNFITVRTVKRTFQFKPRNSAVLTTKVCSTTPVVFNRAFKTSTVVPGQREKEARGWYLTNRLSVCTSWL